MEGLLTPMSRSFDLKLDDPAQAQERLLQTLAAECAATPYGRHHGLDRAAHFHRLPLVDYADLAPWIERERQGERVLLRRPPLGFEPTSGSTGAVKWIPMTGGLRRSFSWMFLLWAADFLAHGPRLETGRIYASLSPRVTEVPAAFASDSEYVTPVLRRLLSSFLVLDPAGHGPANTFLHRLALGLLAEESLEVISIWSPSFLLVLMEHAQSHREGLLQELRTRLSASRITTLEEALRVGNWSPVWPQLKVLSCWDGGHAEPLAKRLGTAFPGVMVQGKGLLATEAPITFPSLAAGGFLPLVDEVYFEFEDAGGNLRLLDELRVGQPYGVVLSQRGGLCRYRLGDQVEVSHRYRRTPCLRFLGRGERVVDLVGEKLSEEFVTSVFQSISVPPGSRLVPVLGEHSFYVLLSSATVDSDALDAALCASHRYQEARRLGQLGPVRAISFPDMDLRWSQWALQTGRTWGGEKPSPLCSHPINTEDLNLLIRSQPC
jgi:hypothetical protein